MNVYRLKFLEDFDDSNPHEYESPSVVEVGDVIRVSNGFHHLVVGIEAASSSAPVLLLGKSGQGPLDATQQTLLGRP